ATELLTLYVALELSAYAMFILLAIHTDEKRGSEAGIKTLLYGAAASAMTLYGLSLIFGMTGTTYLADIRFSPNVDQPLFIIGVALSLAGLLFKLAVFPFHSWAPDAYEGAPHQVVTFVGTVSKLTAAAVIIRLSTLVWHQPEELSTLFFALAVASMTIGNLAALVQKDIKRLLAWSTVAHAGYMLVGLHAFTQTGAASVIFYGMAYVILAYGAFLVISVVGGDGSNPTLTSLRGLHKRSPLLALVLLTSMFGLAGIPPTPGFAGKWFLFAAALERGQFILVLIAAANATVSLYYYLIVVKAAFLDEPEDGVESGPIEVPAVIRWTAIGTLILTVILGVLPAPLWDLATRAAEALLSVS
ncbi:MAG: NADH-quinone oxidoreductase subunit N, partial [Myxococcota bacterium]